MASVEYITKRIEGKQKEISKLEKKLARIIKAQESNWENNPYYYSESDLKWTTKDLEAAKEALAKYEADLVTETEKDNSRNVEAIISFLNGWADRVYDWYCKEFANYQVALADFRMKNEKLMDSTSMDDYREYKKAKKIFDSRWNILYPYIDSKKFDTVKLRKELEQEKKAKYDDIINRANAICGTIKDATGLSVGEKGELNGLVIGERTNARINTIGAGGYNIQCFHFRTLIHEAR